LSVAKGSFFVQYLSQRNIGTRGVQLAFLRETMMLLLRKIKEYKLTK